MTQVVKLYELIGQFINEKRAPASFYEVLQEKVATTKEVEEYLSENADAEVIAGAFQNPWDHYNKNMRQYQADDEGTSDEDDMQEMISATLSVLDEANFFSSATNGILIPKLKLSCLHYAVLMGTPLILLQKALQMCSEEIKTSEDIYGFTPVHYAAIIYKSDSDVLQDNFFSKNMNLRSKKLKITPRQLQSLSEDFYKEPQFLKTQCFLTFYENGEFCRKSSDSLHWADEGTIEENSPCTYINSYLISTSLFKRIFKKKNIDKEYTEYIPPISGEEDLVIVKIDDNVGNGLFTRKDYQKGDVVCHFLGKLDVAYSEFTFNDNYGLANDDILCYGEQYRSLAMAINHSSKNTNVEARVNQCSVIPILEVFALKDIKAGDQLFLDYGQEWFEGRNIQEMEIQLTHIDWHT